MLLYIIPGSFDCFKFWKKIIPIWENKGHTVLVAPVGFYVRSLDLVVKEVTNHIQSIKEPFSIIAISAGCLVAKNVLDSRPDILHHVEHVFAIVPPWHGSWLAISGVFLPVFKEIIPGSSYLKKLHSSNLSNDKIISLRPLFDTEIYPLSSEILEGGTNIQIKTIGHIHIAHHPETIATIEKYL